MSEALVFVSCQAIAGSLDLRQRVGGDLFEGLVRELTLENSAGWLQAQSYRVAL